MKDNLMQHCASAFLPSLGGSIFKIFWHIATNHGGTSFVTNRQCPSPTFSKLLHPPLKTSLYNVIFYQILVWFKFLNISYVPL